MMAAGPISVAQKFSPSLIKIRWSNVEVSISNAKQEAMWGFASFFKVICTVDTLFLFFKGNATTNVHLSQFASY